MTWDFFEGRIVSPPTPRGRMPDLRRALEFRDRMKLNLVGGLNRPKERPEPSTVECKP